MRDAIHNFHLPLSDALYRKLCDIARRTRRPTTAVVREALDVWLRARERLARDRAIVEYARHHGGTAADLDSALELAAVERLLAEAE